MKRTATLLRHLLTFVCAVALVAACGGGADEPGTPRGYGAGQTTEPDDRDTGGDDDHHNDDHDDDATETAAGDDVSIVISDFSYQVPETVPAGAEITITNDDDIGHTVTSDDEGLFDVAVDPGTTITFTAPDEPGDYGFFCIPHPHMTGTLVVE